MLFFLIIRTAVIENVLFLSRALLICRWYVRLYRIVTDNWFVTFGWQNRTLALLIHLIVFRRDTPFDSLLLFLFIKWLIIWSIWIFCRSEFRNWLVVIVCVSLTQHPVLWYITLCRCLFPLRLLFLYPTVVQVYLLRRILVLGFLWCLCDRSFILRTW